MKAVISLKEGSRLDRLLDHVVYGSATGALFEAAYAEALQAQSRGENLVSAMARAAGVNVVPHIFDSQVPQSGPLIVVANHPFGIVEAVALYEYLDRNRPGEVKALVTTAVLDFMPELASHFIAVDLAEGAKNARAGIEMARVLKAGGVVLIFPAGAISRRANLLAQDSVEQAWQLGATKMAIKYETNILPVHIEGSNTRLTDFLFWLGAKFKLGDKLTAAARPWENYRRARLGFEVRVGEAFDYRILQDAGADPQAQTEILFQQYLKVKNH